MEGWVTKSISDVISKTKTIDPRKSPEKEFGVAYRITSNSIPQ